LESGIELPVESLDVSPSIPFFAGKAVGSVHERLEFWKEKIGADEYVLNIVKEGYRLPVFPSNILVIDQRKLIFSQSLRLRKRIIVVSMSVTQLTYGFQSECFLSGKLP
jgi:hypothetical protein